LSFRRAIPVQNYFESSYYFELQKPHNLFEWLISRDTNRKIIP
jgi:hypothetical protein